MKMWQTESWKWGKLTRFGRRLANSVPIIRDVSSDRADSGFVHWKGEKFFIPFPSQLDNGSEAAASPVARCCSSFPLFLSPLARRLEPEGGGKEGKRKERKKGRKEESFVAGSLLATSYSLPGSTYHNSSEEQSDIRKVTHRHTSYCSRASEVVAFSSRNQGHLLYFPLFFFAFLFFLFLSLFFFFIILCDVTRAIYYSQGVLHRDESEQS